ncbi:MAG: ABC transporter ATP-binding protein [Streptosporangiales bacterium]
MGESGSGKSVTSEAIMGLHDPARTAVSGSIHLDGEELVGADEARLRQLRGQRMAMIFQDPLSSLHPFFTVGDQLVEAARVHQSITGSAARARAVEMLQKVGIPNPRSRIDEYPHQMSGGMRQRAMIAMALINDPDLLIADEQTTALDVTVQAQILDLLRSLQAEFGTAIVLITHDLGVVAGMADDVVVMYGARIVEKGDVRNVFHDPQMPYTWGLLTSLPRLDSERPARMRPIPGTPPSPLQLAPGCVFQPRCGFAELVPGGRCARERPELEEIAAGHAIRCHLEPDVRTRLARERIGAST